MPGPALIWRGSRASTPDTQETSQPATPALWDDSIACRHLARNTPAVVTVASSSRLTARARGCARRSSGRLLPPLMRHGGHEARISTVLPAREGRRWAPAPGASESYPHSIVRPGAAGKVFDGGVHSHFAHLYARRQPACYGHTSTSLATGATAPLSAAGYLAAPLDFMKDDYRALAMVMGRCYAMDRDKRWERIKAGLVGFAHAAVNDADEFLMLTIVNGVEGRIKDDGTLFFDYRSGSDRMRELVSAVVHGYLVVLLQECDCRAGQRDMQHGTSTDAAVVTVPVDVTVAADVALDLAQGAVDFIAHRYC
ncbi:BPG-independent [Mycena pura]|uniref:BPG-independent n=1 Tax=Mycena pura TaxID=153505 RepID=A0AAD6V7B5_9AGAR|nr:BPG-independent [Mycena pura]